MVVRTTSWFWILDTSHVNAIGAPVMTFYFTKFNDYSKCVFFLRHESLLAF
jgi:hypothetical protein